LEVRLVLGNFSCYLFEGITSRDGFVV
jgi:hypothetical protein